MAHNIDNGQKITHKIHRLDLVFYILSGILISSLIITNLISGKYFMLLRLPVSCSIITYPINFLIISIISELCGPLRTKILVLTGFIARLLTFLIILIANYLPISLYSPINDHMFKQIFGLLPVLVISSMVSYIISQLAYIQIFEFIKTKTKENKLWLRSSMSVAFSQIIDTTINIFTSLAMWSIINKIPISLIEFKAYGKVVMSQYAFRLIIVMFTTPMVYFSTFLIKNFLKQYEVK